MIPTLDALRFVEALAALREAQRAGRPFELVLHDLQMPSCGRLHLAQADQQDRRSPGPPS